MPNFGLSASCGRIGCCSDRHWMFPRCRTASLTGQAALAGATCDVILVPDRGQITFHDTKNSEPVVAALNDWAVERLIEYLEVRGGRRDNREQPFFLTDEGLPYADNGKACGGQNKSAVNGMKRRTVKTIRRRAAAEARACRRAGDRKAAWKWSMAAKDRAGLVALVTQHWFCHKLATEIVSRTGDLRAAMEQGGWRD